MLSLFQIAAKGAVAHFSLSRGAVSLFLELFERLFYFPCNPVRFDRHINAIRILPLSFFLSYGSFFPPTYLVGKLQKKTLSSLVQEIAALP